MFLNGTRADVRNQETNLGNLTADANLFVARQYDPAVQVSIKNGGGIRDNIGSIVVPAGGTDYERVPPQANPLVGKETGDISQFDIENALRFNNDLALVTVTAEELVALVEHGVAASSPDLSSSPGQFPQVGGIRFGFDPAQPSGDRVQTLAIVDKEGTVQDVVVRGGAVQGAPAGLASGVYLYRLEAGGFRQAQTILLMK